METINPIETTKPELSVKEKYIQDMIAMFKQKLGNDLSTTFMTSSCAPAYGWSREEYAIMPEVASRMRAEGYTITSAVNHGVTDWTILNK